MDRCTLCGGPSAYYLQSGEPMCDVCAPDFVGQCQACLVFLWLDDTYTNDLDEMLCEDCLDRELDDDPHCCNQCRDYDDPFDAEED